ncbi:transcriptional regulator [Clostridium sp.]|uniref:helix-turn-helix transcriptional regulator n=1 Tax=Clostridium sp. TaxID=1506 RepID=UPI0035A03347
MRKINSYLKKYVSLINFLGEVLGEDTEIVLHDITNVDNSVVAISNGHISGRDIGAPATNLVLKILKDGKYSRKEYITNYKGISSEGNVLRSSTYFIKDDKEEIIGMLCINISLERFRELRDFIDKFMHIKNNNSKVEDIEKLDQSVEGIALENMQEIIKSTRIPPERMCQEEKIEVVKKLNENGIFLLKGAVSEIGEQLKSSEATIYRYLNRIKKEVSS